MNRNELRAAIARSGMTVGDFLKAAQITPSTFHRKMQDPAEGDSVPEFTQGEISRIAAALQLTKDDMCLIFFGGMVS